MSGRIPRAFDDLGSRIRPGRVTVLYGPRRVGKTSLVQHYLSNAPGQILRAVGDDSVVRSQLSSQNRSEILAWAEDYDIIFLDEAQRVPGVGWALKMLIDARPDLTVIATGSASFQLTGGLVEPLTGRQTLLNLYPVSVSEILTVMSPQDLRPYMDNLLVFGMYPEVRMASSRAHQQEILRELVTAYLVKDILKLEKLESSKVLLDLLALVAMQTGKIINLNELAQQVNLDVPTVRQCLDLLEKAFILVNVRGFSRNLRSEVTRTSKWYFYDVGLRNAFINNFNPPAMRDDATALWENFLVMERMKVLNYADMVVPPRFWRAWEQQEMDLFGDRDGSLRPDLAHLDGQLGGFCGRVNNKC